MWIILYLIISILCFLYFFLCEYKNSVKQYVTKYGMLYVLKLGVLCVLWLPLLITWLFWNIGEKLGF